MNLAVPIDQLFTLRDEHAIDRYGARLTDRGCEGESILEKIFVS